MLENKKLGILFSIVVILLSTFGSAKMEFNHMQKQLDALYYEEPGMYSDLQALAGNALNIIKIAERYGVHTQALGDQAYHLKESTPQTAKPLVEQLTESFNENCDALLQAGLSEKDEQLLVKQQADFKATLDIIERSPYHELASKIESQLDAFPANILQKITFSELNIYQ